MIIQRIDFKNYSDATKIKFATSTSHLVAKIFKTGIKDVVDFAYKIVSAFNGMLFNVDDETVLYQVMKKAVEENNNIFYYSFIQLFNMSSSVFPENQKKYLLENFHVIEEYAEKFPAVIGSIPEEYLNKNLISKIKDLHNYISLVLRRKNVIDESLLTGIDKLKKNCYLSSYGYGLKIKISTIEGLENYIYLSKYVKCKKPIIENGLLDRIDERLRLRVIGANPWLISEISRPSDDIKRAAIKSNVQTLKVIDNPPLDAFEDACSHASALKFVKEQTPEMAIFAVNKNSNAIKYVDETLFDELSRR